MGFLQTLVNILLPFLHHSSDSWESIFRKHEEDNGKCQEHPEQKSQIRGEDCWQFTEIHSL